MSAESSRRLQQGNPQKAYSYEKIHQITMIDPWFIDKIAILVEMETRLKTEELTPDLLKEDEAY